MVVYDVVVLFGAAIFENGGQGRRAFMLRVYVFRLMGVISRLGCGEGLRDCGYGGGWGGGVSSMLTTELSTYILGSKGMLLSARCKTEVGPRWSHMLPHSRVVILPFSLVQSLGLVREMSLSFPESRMSQVAGF